MATKESCTIEANPDVTGTGIRASVYALCLASGIFTFIIRNTIDNASAAAFSHSINSALKIQGLALLCTAIYQTFRNQLTLFHAICVMHLLSLLGFGLVAKGNYGEKMSMRRYFLWAFKIVTACAFLAFAAYIWIKAPTFGSQPACNATTEYVVFGAAINATEPVFRYAILGLMCALVVGTMFGMAVGGTIYACICGTSRKERLVHTHDVAFAANILGRVDFKDKRVKKSRIQSEVAAVLLATGVNLYAIITLEQTISRNRLSPDEKNWGFGQVLALFLLLGPLAEVLNIILARVDKKNAEDEDDSGSEGDSRPTTGDGRPQQQLLTDGVELQDMPVAQRV